jgi:hypothetical protein
MTEQTSQEKRKTRSAIRYATLKAQGLCVECKQPVTNGKTACPVCLFNRRAYNDTRSKATKRPVKITMLSGYVTISLCDTLEILGLKLRYTEDAYHFSGSREFTVKRTVGDPFDALKAKRMIPTRK